MTRYVVDTLRADNTHQQQVGSQVDFWTVREPVWRWHSAWVRRRIGPWIVGRLRAGLEAAEEIDVTKPVQRPSIG